MKEKKEGCHPKFKIQVIGEKEPQLCQDVNTNFNTRADIYRTARGGRLAEIIFPT